jgi:dTDP-4-dehydrorhamnose 3,5-epimerase
MNIIKTTIPGLLIIEPGVHIDERGYFFESYHQTNFIQFGIEAGFVQDNESKSNKGVLRGLHFQRPPYAQGKLVRVVKGAVLDVAVDIRPGSPSFGQWKSVMITEANKKMVWVPEGFAHGFLVLEDETIFQYKCTNYYHPDSEGCIRWNDPRIGINWGTDTPILSVKDQQAGTLADLENTF